MKIMTIDAYPVPGPRKKDLLKAPIHRKKIIDFILKPTAWAPYKRLCRKGQRVSAFDFEED